MKIHADELYKKIKTGLPKDEIVIDVREDDEWQEGHIPGAQHIPVDNILSQAKKYVGDLKGYSKVYVHCMGGGRAGRACTALKEAGMANAVHVAESGMKHWTEKGYPVEKGK